MSEAHAPRTTVPYMPAGSAVVFDYRLWHRGLQNLGLADRPVLYAVVAKPWWRDHRNFQVLAQTQREHFFHASRRALLVVEVVKRRCVALHQQESAARARAIARARVDYNFGDALVVFYRVCVALGGISDALSFEFYYMFRLL
uniref:Uncharacterized protein n=1 Tax=Chrysotila carterae TaxID=13221 RepID=A0A7S4EUB6_CHRCT